MPEQQEKERELKAAFIQHLPTRIATIGSEWKHLIDGEWDERQVNHLYQTIQNLTGTSGQYGLINLSESSFSLEVYLRKLIDENSPPTAEQQETCSTLISAMNHEVELIRSKSGIERPTDRLIYLLHSSNKLAPGLLDMLEEQGCTVLSFNHPDDVESEVQRRLPNILILDADFLPKFGLLNRELAIQQERHNIQVKVVCLSQDRDLELRLLALRSGVDAYYLTPINTQDLVEEVIELSSPKRNRYRILVVEDDQAQADFAASLLKKSGMTTRVITEPLKVIEALDEFRPDLILMDLYMPDANGMELTTIIREHPDFIMTPIVFLSGEQDMDKQLHALSVGGDDFLSKPIRPRHLVNTIINRIQRARILEKHHYAGIRDSLTGLYSRRYFYEKLDAVTADPQQRPTTGGVLYIHLDKNESGCTQAVYEGFLANLGNVISELLEEQDIASRIDDNIIAILMLRPHEKNILSLSEKIIFKLLGLKGGIQLSPHIGVALFGKGLINASELMANASTACMEIHNSEQRVKRYHDTDDTQADAQEAGNLPHLIRQALQKQSFQILFRTLWHPLKGEPLAYELKPRLRLPSGRQLSSSEILAITKEEGLSSQISQWLIERALVTLQEKQSEGRQINLIIAQTASTIFQDNIISWLRDQLRARQMVGFGLVFEYRIADLSTDLKTAKLFFSQLKELGIKVSLSRFGANMAALRVLQYLQADFIRLAGPILKAGDEEIRQALEQIRQTDAKIILPATEEADSTHSLWFESADLMPAISGTVGH